MLPPLPTGMQSQSGASPSSSHDLERGGLLALEPIRIEVVDEGHRVTVGQLAHSGEGVVEACRRSPRRARRRPVPVRACRARPPPRERRPSSAGPRAPRRRPPRPTCCPSRRRRRPARRPRGPSRARASCPRSLNEPVGFWPSSLRYSSTPSSAPSRGACRSGVDPSPSDTIGVSRTDRQAVAEALDQARSWLGAQQCSSHRGLESRLQDREHLVARLEARLADGDLGLAPAHHRDQPRARRAGRPRAPGARRSASPPAAGSR